MESFQQSDRGVAFSEMSGVAAGSCDGAGYALSSATLLRYDISNERVLINQFQEREATSPELSAIDFLFHLRHAMSGIEAAS
jgi:hypothetical protein